MVGYHMIDTYYFPLCKEVSVTETLLHKQETLAKQFKRLIS